MADAQELIDSPIVGQAIVMGLLYSICHHLWVLTASEWLGIVPPVILFIGYLSFGKDTDIWRCDDCGTVAISVQCPRCKTENPPGSRFIERVVRYTVIVPAGALVVEFGVVLLLEAIFQVMVHVSVVAWYRAEWYGTVGLFGTFGLFLMTLTAPMAYLFSVGAAASWQTLKRKC